MSQPFTLGVNYWLRRKAMYWWSDFDLHRSVVGQTAVQRIAP